MSSRSAAASLTLAVALSIVAAPSGALGASLVLAGTVAGGAVGRLYWSRLSERSRHGVDRLAAELADAVGGERTRP